MDDGLRAVGRAIRRAFSDWDVEKLGRDIVLNIVAAVLIAVAVIQWDRMRWYVTRERIEFRRMFGPGAARTRQVVLVLDSFRDPRWLPAAAQQALNVNPPLQGPSVFYKIFPDGHGTSFPVDEQPLLPSASARAAAYVTDSIAATSGIVVRPLVDEEVKDWDATFVCIGSSYNNIRSDDVKHSAVNLWLADDGGPPKFRFKDGTEVPVGPRQHLGYVLKVTNPHYADRVCIVCGGIGPNGTSAAARYFADNWRRLSRRFKRNGFLIVLAVTPGGDQGTKEIKAYGQETLRRRFWAWVRRNIFRQQPGG
jgi:hypothetical protein